ncbi:MAG: tripartite tricarboxylate transporter substrate binding protein [Alphaproteobacteria bacterium]|nr:tripartite tricarboxylate transporter substrate binding protein [Alphaproteobacteria bacterium]MCW5739174.1 tripartite tricarboxylate transporter substrate binding protein [Alphaproteobacteria bacterium]
MIARRHFVGMAAGLALAGPAAAQAPWPSRPVKLIVTFPPGGASDAAARVIAGPLSEKLGQTVIVDNKPGGGTTIGANVVLQAKDEFHTLMLSNSAPISIAPYLFDKPPYDPIKDFAHVVYIGSVANAFVVRPAVPAKTMPELIAWIKGQGKAVPFGSGGQGSIGHIIGEMFKGELGLNMEHIGYRGAAPMFQDMMAGQLDFAVVTLTEVLPLAKDGKLRMIALTSTQKAPSAPDVPLVTDLGYPKLVAENFVGISAPAGFAAAAQDKLHKAMSAVLGDAKLVERLSDLGFVTKPMSPAEFTAFVANQVKTFQAPVKASGAKL